MKTTFIYALCEPETRTVRYIGKTRNPEKRLQEHLKTSSKLGTHLGHWLSLLVSQGQQPDMIVLREVPGDGSEAEVRYIRLARGCKMRLVNATDGGEGCQNPSPETRAKMSAAQLGEKSHSFGKKRTPETCAKMSAALLGKKRTPETCAKISAAQLGEKGYWFGKKASAETRARQSAALLGEKNPMFGKPSPNKGKPSPNKGVPLPDKTKAKMSEVKLGEKNPMFGRPWTPEHRENVRVARLRNKERAQEIEWALAPYTLE